MNHHVFSALLASCLLVAACGARAEAPALIVSPSPVRPPPRERPASLAGLDPGALALVVTLAGVDVWVGDIHHAPLDGCPLDGPTVCHHPGAAEAVEHIHVVDPGDTDASNRALDRLLAAQDRRRLYNLLLEIKASDSTQTSALIAAAPDIPFVLIVQLLDLTRERRANPDPTGRFADDATFEAAAQLDDSPLFPHVAFVTAE